MGKLKSLAGDTVIYGVSTILGRMLNWLLMPLFIRTIPMAEYGLVVNVYAAISVLLVVATMGFETGYFRFVTPDNRNRLLDSMLSTVLGISVVIISFFALFSDFCCWMVELDSSRASSLIIATVIVLVDALNAILFAELRYDRKSVKYSVLRLIQVVVTVVFTLLFLFVLRGNIICGIDFNQITDLNGILLSNLIGSLSSIFYFLPGFVRRSHSYDFKLLKDVVIYSIPLVGMGFFGMCNQQVEKFMIPKLVNADDGLVELAVYGGNFKIGVLMAIFTQSFRLAFEPFFFKESKDNDKREIYADVMNYFVAFGMIIYAGVILFIPLIDKFIITPAYHRGNVVIPFVLAGQLFFGVYYSLSMWYKKIDKTYYGIIMSFAGLVVNTVLNWFLIPVLGITGAALSAMIGYGVMMILSLLLGNHYYPIPYKWSSILSLVVVGFVATHLFKWINDEYLGSFWIIGSLIGVAIASYPFIMLIVKNLRSRRIK